MIAVWLCVGCNTHPSNGLGKKNALSETADSLQIVNYLTARDSAYTHIKGVRKYQLSGSNKELSVQINGFHNMDTAFALRLELNPSTQLYQVVVPNRSTKSMSLMAGSFIALNAASTLGFHEDFEQTRTFYLSGEAYFKASKGGKNISVKTDRANIVIDSGEADINAYSDNEGYYVSVVSGAVTIITQKATKTIRGSQCLLVSKEGGLKDLRCEAGSAGSWQEGFIPIESYHHCQDIFRIFRRWYNLNVSYEGDNDCSFDGRFPATAKAKDLLRVLQVMGFRCRFNKVNGDIQILLRRIQ